MKKIFIFCCCLFFILNANAQYYLRGEVKDEKNEPLQNVKILLNSDKHIYYSGTSGGFGISCNAKYDSITLSLDGYATQGVRIRTEVFQNITLKAFVSVVNKNLHKLISITKDPHFSFANNWLIDNESYFSLVENEPVNVSQLPNAAFSLNINKASYSNVRRFLTRRSIVPPDAVRIEELLNYFNLRYKEPANNDVFNIESQLTDCPWQATSKLLFLNVNARKLNLDKVPPSNLVFLIDVSGSMDMPNRLPLVKAAFQMLIKNLRAQDTISIVAYGGTVSVWLQPTSGADKQQIIKSIEELTAEGDTPGEAAIRMAYALAEKTFIKGGNNRVILATDGDFNVGEVSEKALEDLITKEKKTGVYLTCLGVGMGNFKDSKLEILSKKGNGNYAYLDDIHEAEKVLVKEMTQTFYAVADDVYLNVHFNPEIIKSYRLIGFDNKKDALTDTSGELAGGEIGSGNSVLAIFEIEPAMPDVDLQQLVPASVTLKYTLPNTKIVNELKYTCPANYAEFKDTDKEYQLATAIAMFGMGLRQSKYLSAAEWPTIERIALNAYDPTNYLQKEFVGLVAIAKKMYVKKRRQSHN